MNRYGLSDHLRCRAADKGRGNDDQQSSMPLTSFMVGVIPPRAKPEIKKKTLLDKDRGIDKPCFRPQIADFPPLAIIPIEHSSVVARFLLSLSFFMRVQ